MLEKKISLFTNNKGNEFLTQLEATLEQRKEWGKKGGRPKK